MRVEDVVPLYNFRVPAYGSGAPKRADTTDNPLDDLILAHATGMLATCHLLAPDEVQLVGVVINNLEADPEYEPSDTMMTAIQAIIWKIAISRVLASA